MIKGSKKYRQLQGELDKIGYMTAIVRQEKKNFLFIINGEIIKSFKKRESINKRIKKLHNEKLQTQN